MRVTKFMCSIYFQFLHVTTTIQKDVPSVVMLLIMWRLFWTFIIYSFFIWSFFAFLNVLYFFKNELREQAVRSMLTFSPFYSLIFSLEAKEKLSLSCIIKWRGTVDKIASCFHSQFLVLLFIAVKTVKFNCHVFALKT